SEKPNLSHCRSADKETFTCWWEPAVDGASLTNYSLWYSVEGDEMALECPDYLSMGPNSCFFDRNHTSIWTIYTITIIATNGVNNSQSDPVFIDVTYIVQPDPPSNVSVEMKQSDGKFFLLVRWSPPVLADVLSGWMNLKYDLRLTANQLSEWEYFYVGLELQFTIFSFQPDSLYIVQVHCKVDHGLWSEWSPLASIRTPRALGIMMTSLRTGIAILPCLISLTLIGVFIVKFD
ncbi:prolactin receptor-like, partial [Mustelus asterias]